MAELCNAWTTLACVLCGLFFCVVAGAMTSLTIVCTSSTSNFSVCPFSENATLMNHIMTSSQDSFAMDMILRALFSGITVACLCTVIMICVWYNIYKCQRKYQVKALDLVTPPIRTVEFMEVPVNGSATNIQIAINKEAQVTLL